jgi:hypothetical protein
MFFRAFTLSGFRLVYALLMEIYLIRKRILGITVAVGRMAYAKQEIKLCSFNASDVILFRRGLLECKDEYG